MQALKFTLIAMTSLLVLAGCKSEIKTETTLSQLQANEAKPTAAYFSAEVLSCRDPQTGLTDSQVLQLREQVEFILPGARYRYLSSFFSRNFPKKSLSIIQLPGRRPGP